MGKVPYEFYLHWVDTVIVVYKILPKKDWKKQKDLFPKVSYFKV